LLSPTAAADCRSYFGSVRLTRTMRPDIPDKFADILLDTSLQCLPE